MNGQQLYEFYVQANADQSIVVDPWRDLDEIDKDVWDRMAVLVREEELP